MRSWPSWLSQMSASFSAVQRSSRYTVRSVARSLRLIDIVADHPAGLTLSEVSRELGASKSATYSLLRTLLDAGYLLEIPPGPRYQLGFALMRLGDAVSRQLPIADVCRPVLQQLTDATGMTSRAAIADRGRPVFVERVDMVVRLLMSFSEMESLSAKVKIVVNRVGLDYGQISLKKAQDTIGREIFCRLPNDYRTMVEVRNNGVPLIEQAPKAPITQAIVTLAEQLCGAPKVEGAPVEEPAKSSSGGLFGFFGKKK